MDTLFQDVRYAVRSLLRSPAFSIVVVMTLALGVGANTAGFTLVRNTLFRAPSILESDRVVYVSELDDRRHLRMAMSYRDYAEYRDQTQSFESIAAYARVPLALGSGSEPVELNGLLVTGNYFELMRVTSIAGRLFSEEDDLPGAAPTVVMGEALFRERFGGDRSLIGGTIIVNGLPVTLVGVAPASFRGLEFGSSPALCLPLHCLSVSRQFSPSILEERGSAFLGCIGRLAPGASRKRAEAEVQTIAARIARENPEQQPGITAQLTSARGGLDPVNSQEARPLFALVMLVTGLVLAIACANVANLLLSRNAARRREFAVRLALGASRGQLIRQLLTENLLLSAVAGLLGFVAAAWGIRLSLAHFHAPSDVQMTLSPDAAAVAFSLLLSALTGLFFGLVPALHATRVDLVSDLKDEAVYFGQRFNRSRLQGLFVTAQVALSLALLSTATLALRGLHRASTVDIGFTSDRVLAASFDLSLQGYSARRAREFGDRLLGRALLLPGVRSASLMRDVPMSGRMRATALLRDGETEADHMTSFTVVWPGALATLAVPMVRGREFRAEDDSTAAGGIVLNEILTRQLFGETDPLGRQLRFGEVSGPLLTVIGVARDGKYDERAESPRGFFYVSALQDREASGEFTLLVRTSGDPRATIPAVAGELRALDPNLPLSRVTTLEEMIEDRDGRSFGIAGFLGLFGGLASLLAALGIYGVMAYVVSRRTREIGVRLALGAEARQVSRMILLDGCRLASIGIAIGIALAAMVGRLVASQIPGVEAFDLVTFVTVPLLLAGVAALASWIPARRAASVQPVVALHAE